MKNIKDFDLDDLKKELIEIGEKPFRAEQIFKWLYQEKVKEFVPQTIVIGEAKKAPGNACIATGEAFDAALSI